MAELLTSVPHKFRVGKLHGDKFYLRDRVWTYYDSPLSAYQKEFKSVLNGKKIEDLLIGKTNPVVVDLMASTSALEDLFSRVPGDGKLGIAVSLEDLRDPLLKESNTSSGIFQVAGDITSSKTWREIESHLNGRKADLIIERAYGGLGQLPKHPGFYGIVLQRMWKMLSSEGVILIQIPSKGKLEKRGISIQAWVDTLNKSGIVASYNNGISLPSHLGSLFIQRSLLSPNYLPFPPEVFQQIPSQLDIDFSYIQLKSIDSYSNKKDRPPVFSF